MTDRDALIGRLRAIAARFDMTSTERYEQDSEAFYAQTGYMAPGKDVPMAMGGQDETERRAAHESWIAGRNRSQQQAIQEAADALAALPPPADMNTAAEHYRQGWQAGHAAADPLPPRPTGSEPINRVDLVRYGVATPGSPTLLTPMADGYWTPWHIAAQTPADPPALVALVREWQRKQRGCDIENTAAAYAELDIAEAELLAYPLPAAPPVTDTCRQCGDVTEQGRQYCTACAILPPFPPRSAVTDTPQGWQPIETAPKDGTIIRVFAEHEFDPGPEQYFAYWRRDARYTSGGVWQDRDREIIVHPDATHWMPCEAAPPQEDQ